MEHQFPNPNRIFVFCYSSCLIHTLSPLTSLICCHGKELPMAINFSPETFLLILSSRRKQSGRVLHQKRCNADMC